ncbi:hypothetical protein ACJJTC_015198 [Scirpophaga incertulas]
MVSDKKMNEDLDRERQKCTFSIEELTNYLDGGSDYTRKRREIENKVLSIKDLRDEVPEEYLSHKEKYENAVRKAVIYYKVMREHDDPNKSFYEKIRVIAAIKEIAHFCMDRRCAINNFV